MCGDRTCRCWRGSSRESDSRAAGVLGTRGGFEGWVPNLFVGAAAWRRSPWYGFILADGSGAARALAQPARSGYRRPSPRFKALSMPGQARRYEERRKI